MPFRILARKLRARTSPQHLPTPVGVNVTVTRREAEPECGLEFVSHPEAAHIRAHLPRVASPNLTACRFAAVLDREAAFLADKTGTVAPPERWEVIEACRAGAEALRDGVVIR
jgi:hypothetical protein